MLMVSLFVHNFRIPNYGQTSFFIIITVYVHSDSAFLQVSFSQLLNYADLLFGGCSVLLLPVKDKNFQ